MTTSKVEKLVENKKKVTEAAIEFDLNNDHWDALYFASEQQIQNLIQKGRIDEDFSSRHQTYQEELRVLENEM
jgi:HEPN domain-containing protein